MNAVQNDFSTNPPPGDPPPPSIAQMRETLHWHDGHNDAVITLLAQILAMITPDDERPDLLQMLSDLRPAGTFPSEVSDTRAKGFRRAIERIEEEFAE
ncbi:MAG: hypothetical protein OXI26_10185 [bacterium]|nr:hypothetical protein [bacterium]